MGLWTNILQLNHQEADNAEIPTTEVSEVAVTREAIHNSFIFLTVDHSNNVRRQPLRGRRDAAVLRLHGHSAVYR